MSHIRIRREDRQRLREMRKDSHVRQMLVDEGIIDEVDQRVSYGHILRLLVPEDGEERSRSLATVKSGDAYEDLKDLAGTNVSMQEVVHEFVEQFDETERKMTQ